MLFESTDEDVEHRNVLLLAHIITCYYYSFPVSKRITK